MKDLDQVSRIWTCKDDLKTDSYRLFRKTFRWSKKDGDVLFRIAVNDTFLVRINGRRVAIQQLTDLETQPTYSEAEITSFLQNGENEILVEVHRIGIHFSTVRNKPPYLQAAIFTNRKMLVATDSDWECSVSSAYTSGLNCKVTPQMGLAFEYDMRREFSRGKWKKAEVVSLPLPKAKRRDIPQLIEHPAPPVKICMTGVLVRDTEAETFGAACYTDRMTPCHPHFFFEIFDRTQITEEYYSKKFVLGGDAEPVFTTFPLKKFPGANGYYIVCDLGHETVGYLTFSADAPAGTVVDVAYGEHLDDGRVRSHVGGRNFADRIHCKKGRNDFIYVHRRIACRYLELHITNLGKGKFSLRRLSLIPLELPLPEECAFHCEDRLLERTSRIAADTLKCCMHEHYEDCPWREQALYAYDSRNQMLYGYYLWGNTDFARAALNMLGESGMGKRYLELTSPGWSDHGITIPIFTLVWISAMKENILFSGKDEIFRQRMDQVDRIIDTALASPDENFKGLYHPGTESVWNFCEWNGILSRAAASDCTSFYNIYLYECLKSAAKMHRLCGSVKRAEYLEKTASVLGGTIERTFYDSGRHLYLALAGNPQPEEYEHIQALMLANGLVPAKKIPVLLELFCNGKLRKIDLSAMYYFVTAMMNSGKDARKYLTKSLTEIFDPIILSGATSLWETRQGADDFDDAGSLCHAWSSVMPYFCKRHILGVAPLEPGFRKFQVKPYPAHLTHAEGEIPTPYGKIKVAWTLQNGKMTVRLHYPEGTEPVCESYPEYPVVKWIRMKQENHT